jgi:hypothetical protein
MKLEIVTGGITEEKHRHNDGRGGQAGEEKRDTPFIPDCLWRNRLFVNFCEIFRNVGELVIRAQQDAGLKPLRASG